MTLPPEPPQARLIVYPPSEMEVGDLLVVFLIAMGVHWGNAYAGYHVGNVFWHQEFGNPPWGTPLLVGEPASLEAYPHHPPVSTLARGVGSFDHRWFSGGGGFYGNYWSNLGRRDMHYTGETPWDNENSQAALALWPFINAWWGPQDPEDPGFNPEYDPCMYTITTVARIVDGTETASFTFTLNNPLDAEYDYRGVALAFSPNDWAGNYYDNKEHGGTDAKSLDAGNMAWFAATGTRDERNMSTLLTNIKMVDEVPLTCTTTQILFLNYVVIPALGEMQSEPPPEVMPAAHHEITVTCQVRTNLVRATGTPDQHEDIEAWAEWSHQDWPPPTWTYTRMADPTTDELDETARPQDLQNDKELILNLICYAAPTSFGDPTEITVADLSREPHIDPLPTLYEDVWTKGASTLMIRFSQTHPYLGHETTPAGDGIVTLTHRVFTEADEPGPIAAPYPTPLPHVSVYQFTEICVGLALTFRLRVPFELPDEPVVVRPPGPPSVYIPLPTVTPSRLATIVG